jgi:hypothetical protein
MGPGRRWSLRSLRASGSAHHWESLRLFDAIRPGPPLTEILCPFCEQQRVRPRFRSEGRYVASCFECGDVAIPAEHLDTIEADFDWFFSVLANAFPTGTETSVLVPELLWLVTTFEHRSKKIEVLFARLPGDAESERRAARALNDLSADRRLLVFTSRESALEEMTLQGRRVVVCLPAVATLEEYGLDIRGPLIDLVVGPMASAGPGVDVAADGSWLRIGERELRLAGKQRDFALVMVEAWRADNRRPKLEWVLRRAGYGDGTSELKHVTKRREFFEFFGYGNGEVWILA